MEATVRELVGQRNDDGKPPMLLAIDFNDRFSQGDPPRGAVICRFEADLFPPVMDGGTASVHAKAFKD